MSCRTNRSSVNWGADLARTPPRSAPPATSPECLALVADAEAAARYLATYGMKIRGATVEETEAARFALPTGAIPSDMYVPAGPWVDIYLSAGPNDEDGSCDVDDDSNCRLYRVRWNLVAGTAYEVVELTSRVDRSGECPGGPGDVELALSPDERSLAWIRRCGSWSKLLRQSRGEVAPTTVAEGVADAEGGSSPRPEFPNWVSDDLLAFHTMRREPKQGTIWYTSSVSAPAPWLGPLGALRTETSFQDPDTHRAPAYRGATGPRLVTHGGGGTEKKPRVTNLFGGEEESFDLGFGGDEAECHHAAWNIEGTRILCHAASSSDPFGGGRRLTTLYEYQYDAARGSWVRSETSAGSDGKVFDSPDASVLDALLFRDGSTGRYYFFKYAEWCGSDDYVLATLYCKDADDVIRSSRVVVVTLHGPDGAPSLSDVTGAVEEAIAGVGGEPDTSTPRPHWSGVFGTCSRPRHLPFWTATLR